MGKTEVTKEIEKQLFRYFFLKRSMRCALEVQCPKIKKINGHKSWWFNGRCDFVACEGNDFLFIEIKVSFADFKSKNGHNLVGDKNYYAVTSDIADRVMPLLEPHIGLYVWDGEKLECRKRCKRVKEPEFMKITPHYGKSQIEWMHHYMITACNSTINRLL